jgi:hypothetical protein
VKEKALHILMGVLIVTVVVLGLWWDAESKLKWQNAYIERITNEENSFELVSKWNQVSLNPFTWKNPYSDKLIYADSSDIVFFEDDESVLVFVRIVLNTRRLKIDDSRAFSRNYYAYDLKNRTVEYGKAGLYGERLMEEEFELLEKGTQAFTILEWAVANIENTEINLKEYE